MGRTKRKKRRRLRREERPVREQIEIMGRMLAVLAQQVQDAGAKVVAMAKELQRVKHVALGAEAGDDDDS